MTDRQSMLTALRKELARWDALLGSLSEAQIVTPPSPGELSVKDVMAHLHAWQQISIARLEAALAGGEPVMPGWLGGKDPESEEDTDDYNATIHAAYREQSWPQVYQTWRDGFLRFLQLAEQLPEDVLFDTARFHWLNGYAPFAVLEGSYEHHHADHYEPLLAWSGQL